MRYRSLSRNRDQRRDHRSIVFCAALLFAFLLAGDVFCAGPAFAYGAEKAPGKAVISSVQVEKNAVTVKWKKAKGAKAYRVYVQTGENRWAYWKSVKKNGKNKAKYANPLKYKLKVKGKKYRVYRQKNPFRLVKTTKARKFKYTGIYDTRYGFAVQAKNGKKYGKISKVWRARTEAAERPVPDDGWQTIGENTYYFRQGVMLTGIQQIGDKTYWFDETSGAMITDKWNGDRYFSAEGPELQVLKDTSAGIQINGLENNTLNSYDVREAIPAEHRDEPVTCRISETNPSGTLDGTLYRARGYVLNPSGSVKYGDTVQIIGKDWTRRVKITSYTWFAHRVLPYANNEQRLYSPGNYVGETEVTDPLEVAKQAGAFGVEIDVWRTSDGAFVVNHDNNFKRTHGVSGLICKKSLEKIRSSKKLGTVVTLEEMLRACKEHDLKVLIEMKELRQDHPDYGLSVVGSAEDAAELTRCVEASGISPDDILFYGLTWVKANAKGHVLLDDEGNYQVAVRDTGVLYANNVPILNRLIATGKFHYRVRSLVKGVYNGKSTGTIDPSEDPFFDSSYPGFVRYAGNAFRTRNTSVEDFPMVTPDNVYKSPPSLTTEERSLKANIFVDADGVMSIALIEEESAPESGTDSTPEGGTDGAPEGGTDGAAEEPPEDPPEGADDSSLENPPEGTDDSPPEGAADGALENPPEGGEGDIGGGAEGAAGNGE